MNAIQLHIPPEDLEVAFAEYKNGENLYSVADALGIPASRFEALYTTHIQKSENKKPDRQENIPVTKRKTKVVLTDDQRAKISKMLADGNKRRVIAEKFGVSVSAIDKIKKRASVSDTVEKTGRLFPEPQSSVKLDTKPELTVTFEADYIVVRIPRKTILSSFLRDLI